MTWSSRYLPPDPSHWQGRADTPEASCFFQRIQLLSLHQPLPASTQDGAFALLGFCCDEGIRRNLGRIGAAEGPKAIRQALARFPVQRSSFSCVDAGDITCTDGDLESAQQALGEVVALLLHHGYTPIVMGGGHEMAWGHYQGIAQTLTQEKIGIINFDAHFDMRPLLPHHQGSSGTPFLQIASLHEATQRPFDYYCVGIQHTGNIPALFNTATQHHTHILFADDLYQSHHEKGAAFMNQLMQNDAIYASLCLDVFAAAFAPGVSAPQSLGVAPWHILPFIRQLAMSGKVVSYDIAELSPPLDIDHRTAKLAASFIYEITHHHDFKRIIKKC